MSVILVRSNTMPRRARKKSKTDEKSYSSAYERGR
jgi:hypothetical protein